MALPKRPAVVISFDSTTAAMEAEELFLSKGLPGRIIPLPREISAGCGLSWKAAPGDEKVLLPALDEAGIEHSGVYSLVI
ncbi:MAG: DUF3343 domain-containing protein [Tractidigestivibacter sp.]|jgi:hypothetical protein|uniref:DUF3343 domain-containing protein n=1 Tax=Tractidigestivibacter sp. TaxID=2847320 RepID=UPI003D8B4B28